MTSATKITNTSYTMKSAAEIAKTAYSAAKISKKERRKMYMRSYRERMGNQQREQIASRNREYMKEFRMKQKIKRIMDTMDAKVDRNYFPVKTMAKDDCHSPETKRNRKMDRMDDCHYSPEKSIVSDDCHSLETVAEAKTLFRVFQLANDGSRILPIWRPSNKVTDYSTRSLLSPSIWKWEHGKVYVWEEQEVNELPKFYQIMSETWTCTPKKLVSTFIQGYQRGRKVRFSDTIQLRTDLTVM